jgi:ABC-2 type transport system ATP-binding protein
MTAAAAIEARALTKYYGPVVAVDDLSFRVEQGEIYGFLGANGAGKTSTMRLLVDLLRPSRGSARVLGLDCQRDSRAVRRLVGYLPGELPIYPDLSAEGFLDYLVRLDGRSVRRDYLQQLLDRFDVSRVDLRRPLRTQSHGMKQKIGIIQALASEPPVLVLDEPTAGLDPLMGQAFRDTLQDLKRAGGTTVFLSSHVLAEVESTCDRIGLLRDGRMVASETMEALRRQSARAVTVVFTEPVGEPPPLAGATWRVRADRRWIGEVAGPLGPLLRALATLPVGDLQMDPFRLEDYILGLYGVDLRPHPPQPVPGDRAGRH